MTLSGANATNSDTQTAAELRPLTRLHEFSTFPSVRTGRRGAGCFLQNQLAVSAAQPYRSIPYASKALAGDRALLVLDALLVTDKFCYHA
jgi:hypothetical protein